VQASIVTGATIAFVVVLMFLAVGRHEDFLKKRDAWITAIAWDPSWPNLPFSNDTTFPRDVAQAIYAFAATHPEVLQYIPCYCGCQSQRHQSNADCYVKHRTAGGRVSEWNSHGLTCPVGPDITGDVMQWREGGLSLTTIRKNIDDEYGSTGPATETPHPRSP
jgi:hypothetical protein